MGLDFLLSKGMSVLPSKGGDGIFSRGTTGESDLHLGCEGLLWVLH